MGYKFGGNHLTYNDNTVFFSEESLEVGWRQPGEFQKERELPGHEKLR